MIIECVNCNKKFNVNSELIPSDGRQIQCGSCNYTWHYKNDEDSSIPLVFDNIEKKQTSIVASNIVTRDSENFVQDKSSTIFKQEIVNNENTNNKNKSISNFFSYIVLFVISLIALLILVDTLKSPLINIFPHLEIILFNLFEILEDIKLFIIDLT